MRNYFIYLYTTVLFISLLFIGTGKTERLDVVYIDLSEVLEKYSMKEELEDLLNQELTRRKEQVDALRVQVENNTHDSLRMKMQHKQYMLMLEDLRRFREEKGKEINNQLLSRINKGAREFGEEEGYSYVLGANGTGSIMYAGQAHDVTKRFITYLNRQNAGS